MELPILGEAKLRTSCMAISFVFDVGEFETARADLSLLDDDAFDLWLDHHTPLEQLAKRGRWFYFNRLLVPAEVRGQRIGSRLMRLVTDWADQNGFNIYNPVTGGYLANIKREMPRLLQFYSRWGFVSVESKDPQKLIRIASTECLQERVRWMESRPTLGSR